VALAVVVSDAVCESEMDRFNVLLKFLPLRESWISSKAIFATAKKSTEQKNACANQIRQSVVVS
jgi:hypothetical protein